MTLALTGALVLLAGAYAWRWRSARPALPFGRLWAFLFGVLALWAAVASPLAHLDQGQLTGHMLEHLLIMTVAAPLLIWGEPARLLQRPQESERPRRGWRVHPVPCWLAGTLVVLIWHLPRVFEVGMRWHGLQHATFLAAGLLFWLPVLTPWPSVSPWPRWSIPLYLFLATLPCDGLSAFLVFCGRVVYRHYEVLDARGLMPAGCPPPMNAISALEDQQRAGALMWFWVTLAYALPAALVTIELLSPAEPH